MDQSGTAETPSPGDANQSPSASQSPPSPKPESETGSTEAAPSGSDSGGADKPDSVVTAQSSTSTSSGSVKSVPESPKVQFGEGTKERDGSVKGVKRVRRSFKDLSSKEVIAAGQDSPPRPAKPPPAGGGGTPAKSILKVSRSEPILSAEESEKNPLGIVNRAYEEDAEDSLEPPATPEKTKVKRTTSITVTDVDSDTKAGSKSSAKSVGFPLIKREGSTSSGGSRGFADVVNLLIQRSSIDLGGRDMHPFGRDCSIEGILQASRPKSHSKNSAFGKLVIWMTLLSILVGAALGIIFLSEMYNNKLREQKQLRASHNISDT